MLRIRHFGRDSAAWHGPSHSQNYQPAKNDKCTWENEKEIECCYVWPWPFVHKTSCHPFWKDSILWIDLPQTMFEGLRRHCSFQCGFLPNSLAYCNMNKSDQQMTVYCPWSKYQLWMVPVDPKDWRVISVTELINTWKPRLPQSPFLQGVPGQLMSPPDRCGCGVTRPDCCHLFPWGWPRAPHTFVLWAARNVLRGLSIWQPFLCSGPCPSPLPVFLEDSQGLGEKQKQFIPKEFILFDYLFPRWLRSITTTTSVQSHKSKRTRWRENSVREEMNWEGCLEEEALDHLLDIVVWLERQGKGFPDGPVAKTLRSQCRGPRFDPWSGK